MNLSKTQYLAGLQCEKALWLELNGVPKPDPGLRQLYMFEMGHAIERYAHKLFPEGIHVGDCYNNFQDNLQLTAQELNGGTSTLFEATFAGRHTHCRSDIVQKVSRNQLNINEIKMSTKIKNMHFDDLAFQRYCAKCSGHKINSTFLMHINREYVRKGDIDSTKLFTSVDMTDDVAFMSVEVPLIIKKLLKAAGTAKPPKIMINSQCKTPYKCSYYDYCLSQFPEYSIYALPYSSRSAKDLEAEGITLIKDIPNDFPLSQRQRMYTASVKQGKPTINRSEIRSFLKLLKYPVYYLDFETISPVIPLWNNTQPYELIPFQYSLHVNKGIGKSLKHHYFLAEGREDPRSPLISHMLLNLGNSGSIVAYNASYEKGIIQQLATRFPKYSSSLKALLPRFLDLIVPFRSGDYSDYRFGNSVSLKSVLPVLVPKLSYDNMPIKNGDEASLVYEDYKRGKIDGNMWSKKRDALLQYCELDSLAMVEIVEKLRS